MGYELLPLTIYGIKLELSNFIGGTLCPQQIHPNRAAARQNIGRNAQKTPKRSIDYVLPLSPVKFATSPLRHFATSPLRHFATSPLAHNSAHSNASQRSVDERGGPCVAKARNINFQDSAPKWRAFFVLGRVFGTKLLKISYVFAACSQFSPQLFCFMRVRHLHHLRVAAAAQNPY